MTRRSWNLDYHLGGLNLQTDLSIVLAKYGMVSLPLGSLMILNLAIFLMRDNSCEFLELLEFFEFLEFLKSMNMTGLAIQFIIQ